MMLEPIKDAFQSCRNALNFNNFCEYVFSLESVSALREPEDIKALQELVRNLSETNREKILISLLEDAAGDPKFGKVPEKISPEFNCCLETLGRSYLRCLQSVFEGLCSLDKFHALCGQYFRESFATFDIHPKAHDIFAEVLPQRFYRDRDIKDIIASQIFFVAKKEPILLPEYASMPGFKEVLAELRADPENRKHFKDCVDDYMDRISGKDVKKAVRRAEKVLEDYAIESEISVGRQLASAIEMLGIQEICSEPRFVACVSKQINNAFAVRDPISASNWLAVLPRDPDAGMKLTPDAERLVRENSKIAYRYIVKYMESDEGVLRKRDIPVLVQSIRDFLPFEDRKSERFASAVEKVCRCLARMDAPINYHYSLLSVLPHRLRERIVLKDSYALRVLPSHSVDVTSLNCDVKNLERRLKVEAGTSSETDVIREIASLARKIERFRTATSFFGFACSELQEFSPSARAALRTYYHLSDMCLNACAPLVRECCISVNKAAWIKLVDRADKLLSEGRIQKAGLYVERALRMAVRVPGIEQESQEIARLYNLRARTETLPDKQAEWLSKELFLRIKSLNHVHDSLAPVYKSFSRLLKEKARRNPPGGTREEMQRQARLCRTLARGIEAVNRRPDSKRVRAIRQFLNSAMNAERLHRAVGFNTAAQIS